jgi:hypothetical protein
MEVELPRNATIRDLKRLVGERLGVNPAKVYRSCVSPLTTVIVCRNILEKVLQAPY